MQAHHYHFKNLQYSCGHIADRDYMTGCAYEPTAKKRVEKLLCPACQKKEREARLKKEHIMRQKALDYCLQHNISTTESNIAAYADNAEITIYIK